MHRMYLVCLLSAATSAVVMQLILRQRLRIGGRAALSSGQQIKIYFAHAVKAFTVILVTLAGEYYVYATVDFTNKTQLLKAFQLLLGGGLWAFSLILAWDMAVAAAMNSHPEELPKLRRLAVVGVIVYALLPILGLWYVQNRTQRAATTRLAIADLWEASNRVAIAIKQNPTYDLHAVEEHITALFMSPRTAYELYEIGEQKGVFPFHKRSYVGLQRWVVLDNLLTALAEHARTAAQRGDWQRCNRALQLALRTMKEASELRVPDDLKPRLDRRMAPVQSFALIHIRGGFERIYPLLKEIARQSPAHEHHIEHALQQGKRVGHELGDLARKSGPLLSTQLQPTQYRQLEVIFDESLRKLSLHILRWQYSIEDALKRISSTQGAAAMPNLPDTRLRS